jgi:hypothetical protein
MYLRGLGEHQIPSHPHTHWEEKYQRSKQSLEVWDGRGIVKLLISPNPYIPPCFPSFPNPCPNIPEK